MTDYTTLKLTSPMMHGPAVVRLQELCDSLGFDTGVNDGIYGPNTEMAVRAVQTRLGIKVDGICGPVTWDRIINESGEYRLIDRCSRHPSPKLFKCWRPWTDIRGVTLHQTGCRMPQNASGWDRLNAHVGITQSGNVIIINDPSQFIWHAQGLSATTIGVEIEGNFSGIWGDLRTLWEGGGPSCSLNDSMLRAADAAFNWIKEQFRYYGQTWRVIHAHRQAKDTRIADPGEEIWKKIALPWIDRLNRNDPADGGPDFHLGSGRPIPTQWDCKRKAKYA